MKIWITGIAGFLGSHLADALLADGHQVSGNDSLICGDAFNVPVHLWRKLDCCNFEGMKEALDQFKPDVLVHCAATASEGFSVFSPHFITKNIAEASVATFSAAIAAGVKRIVFMSSMARYGNGRYNTGTDEGIVDWKEYGNPPRWPASYVGPPFKEGVHLTAPIDPYGIAKVYAEQQLIALCKEHGVEWSILVPHNIVGTRQQITPYRNVVSIFLNRLKLDMPVYIYGDGEQKRCFSPVADCIPSIMCAIHGYGDGEVINIGPDNGEITINRLLDICEEIEGKKAERVYLDPRPLTDSVKDAYCSADKARKFLGYQPRQSLESCIREMSEHMTPKPFEYDFPIEISTAKVPRTWAEKL